MNDAGDAILANWAQGSSDNQDHGEALLKSWSEDKSDNKLSTEDPHLAGLAPLTTATQGYVKKYFGGMGDAVKKWASSFGNPLKNANSTVDAAVSTGSGIASDALSLLYKAGGHPLTPEQKQSLTYAPRTEGGKTILGLAGAIAKPVSDAVDLGAKGVSAVTPLSEETAKEALNTGLVFAEPVARGVMKNAPRVIDKGAKLESKIEPKIEPKVEPKIEAEVAPDMDVMKAAPKFEEAPPLSKEQKKPSAEEQTKRAQVFKELGLDEVRRSALTGDLRQGNTDFDISKLSQEPGGQHMARVVDAEKHALQSYSDGLVKTTGGTLGSDQATMYARGNTMLQPLSDLKDFFEKKTKDLYSAARERAKGQPVELSGINEVLNQKSNFSNTDTINLRDGIKSRMEELGMIDKDGNILPSTVDQAEALRQYIGENWSPRATGASKKLKASLDEDVTKAAGEDIFKEARAMHKLRADTLDNPNGIAKVLDSDGPINRSIDIEKLPTAITNLPVDQFNHVIKTLENVPKELQPQAQAALAEIRAQYANGVREAGHSTATQWNNKSVTQYLNKNSARMMRVFGQEGMEKFRMLNDAGNYLRKDTSYVGAEAQKQNLFKTGAVKAIEPVATLLGSTGGPFGALGGKVAGSKLAEKMGNAASLKEAKARTVKLNELMKGD